LEKKDFEEEKPNHEENNKKHLLRKKIFFSSEPISSLSEAIQKLQDISNSFD
jgi:hypothetical protein